ncbi:AAA family ATPase [Streptomyces triculaminicus]|uniref:AAA family ATPase n=1 Tax=Streptomyces triculaminicus TaxID=2816232 RepID=UPI0037D654BE
MTPLLDRRRELELITTALRTAATAGSGSLIVVTGGIGTGKTALLRALPALAQRHGTRTLTAGGAPLERDLPYGLAGQLLEPLRPGAALEPPGPDPYGELLAPVAEHSAREPLLLLVDDLHWADPPSLRWLGRLARRLPDWPVTLVAALREGDPGAEEPRVQDITDRAAHVLRPGPLTQAGTAALVAAALGRPADPAYVTACREATGGNPMFLTATLAALSGAGHGHGDLVPAAERARTVRELRLPALRERLAVALRSQPGPVRELAKALAVLGDGTDPELVGRLAGLDTTGQEEAARGLRRLGLLAEGPEPRFVHHAVRDAVEDSMTPPEHEHVHVLAALLLHRGGHPAEQTAAQLLAAPSCQDGWTVEALRAAAEAAERRGAHQDAARYLRRALLGASPSGPDRAALLVDLATVERAFDPLAAVRHISQALLLLPSAAQRAEAAVRIPPSLLGGGPPPVVEAVGKLACELGEPGRLTGDERELALGLEARLRHAAVTGPGGLPLCAARLRELGPAPALGTAAERELVTVLLHGATMSQSLSAAEVAPLAGRVLQHEPASPDHVHTALPLLVHVLIATDSLEAIGPWLRTARERARARRATVPQALVAIERTHVLVAQGRLADARASADEALALGVADWATLQSMTAVVLVALETRDAELARRLLSYRPEGADHGYRPSSLQLIRGSCAARRGDLPTALEYFLDWGRSAERADWRNPAVFPWRAWAAGLHYRLGETGRAHDLVDEEYVRATAWGAPVAIGRAQRVKGALTAGEKGIALLRESAATLEGAVNGMERARTALLLGRRLLRAGRAEAETWLRLARDQALVCGAPWLAEGAGRDLRTLAGSRTRQTVAALTRAERRVAGLAARGASNREIAEQLEVSSRAVEKHLTHAYRKLNLAGRTQLADVPDLLAELGAAVPPGPYRTAAGDRTEPKHRGT